jgi:Tat protein translocase TatB subunit
MFDLSWGEMGLIALIALIVIGPKELPQVLRTVRTWLGAARGMAREFQGHVDDMMKDSGIDEVRKSIRENTALHLADLADQVDPDRKIREAVDPKSYDPNLLLGDDPAAPPRSGRKSSRAAANSILRARSLPRRCRLRQSRLWPMSPRRRHSIRRANPPPDAQQSTGIAGAPRA